MPCVKINSGFLCLSESGFQPGDMPPDGYIARQEWAEVQMKAGLKQVECGKCGYWRFPQQLSEEIITQTAQDKKGNPVTLHHPVCLVCSA